MSKENRPHEEGGTRFGEPVPIVAVGPTSMQLRLSNSLKGPGSGSSRIWTFRFGVRSESQGSPLGLLWDFTRKVPERDFSERDFCHGEVGRDVTQKSPVTVDSCVTVTGKSGVTSLGEVPK